MHAAGAPGEKLIDHLKKWLEPDKLLAVAHSWDPGQECHIAAAILDLFHLLPPPAVKFLETGVCALLSYH
jgi:transformation/transcription domain-associated protein